MVAVCMTNIREKKLILDSKTSFQAIQEKKNKLDQERIHIIKTWVEEQLLQRRQVLRKRTPLLF